jgi:hypothetical protein
VNFSPSTKSNALAAFLVSLGRRRCWLLLLVLLLLGMVLWCCVVYRE